MLKDHCHRVYTQLQSINIIIIIIIILCDFAISFEFHPLAQKFQCGVIIYSVI